MVLQRYSSTLTPRQSIEAILRSEGGNKWRLMVTASLTGGCPSSMAQHQWSNGRQVSGAIDGAFSQLSWSFLCLFGYIEEAKLRIAAYRQRYVI